MILFVSDELTIVSSLECEAVAPCFLLFLPKVDWILSKKKDSSPIDFLERESNIQLSVTTLRVILDYLSLTSTRGDARIF